MITARCAYTRCLPRYARQKAWGSASQHGLFLLYPKKGTGCSNAATMSRRHFTPMPPQEEEQEKQRVATLSDFAKDKELRQLNRQIATLEMKKGILTGERYSWSGRYKELARNYGFPLVVWYWACWSVSFGVCFAVITIGNVDAMALVERIDAYMNWDTASKIDPSLGQLGLTLVVNELIEPLRLPLVIMTVKPVMDRVAPPKF